MKTFLWIMTLTLWSPSLFAADLTPVTAADVLKVVNSRSTKATLVNLWATWCEPCKKEFPDILKLAKKHPKDLSVVFVSMDFEDQKPAVLDFLKTNNVAFETYMKHQSDNDFITQLMPKWEGALPTTMIYDQNHKMVKMWAGDADYAKFEREVKKVLK